MKLRQAVLVGALGLAPSLAVAAETPAWQQAIAQGLGKPGAAMPGGVYRVGLPRTDLKVTLDGTPVSAGLALGSWLAFSMSGKTAMVMGDLVLTDAEVNPVMKKLEAAGIEITALHNHLLRNEPFTMYMHVLGHGEPGKLAATLREALGESKTPFDAPPPAAQQAPALDTAALDRAIGFKGKANGAVYAFTIPRAEQIREAGMIVPEAMGSAIAIGFQPTGDGKAATTGDFVLVGKEVNPVLRELREHGIEVTAIHNHMLTETPRLFFMHFWAHDEAAKLAEGLGAALKRVNTAKPRS